jgi:hypothetical protein
MARNGIYVVTTDGGMGNPAVITKTKCLHSRTQRTIADGRLGPIICIDCGNRVRQEEIEAPFIEPKKRGRPKKNEN